MHVTSFVQLSTNGPPNMADIQSQLEMSSGLWAIMVPSSNLNTTSVAQDRRPSVAFQITIIMAYNFYII